MREVDANVIDQSAGFSPEDHDKSGQEGEVYNANGVFGEKGFGFASKDVCDSQKDTKRSEKKFDFFLSTLKD